MLTVCGQVIIILLCKSVSGLIYIFSDNYSFVLLLL
jgi:hypothetical protein